MLDSAIQVLNEAGQTWWSYVFPLTWTSSLVAAILLAVVWIGRRWPAQLRYAIVLIALIKFTIPPTLTAPIGLFNWFGPAIIERTESSAVSEQSTDSEADNYSWSTIFSTWKQLNWRAHLMLLHIIGSVLAGAWAISRLIKLASITHRATRVKTGKWYDLFARLSKQLGLSRPVSLLVSSEAVPPMAFGLLRPRVMVPVSVMRDLPSRQIKTMLAHELAHHKRADLWVNALQNVLGILWWFNPLIRLLNQAIRRIREDCCDDLLLCRKIATDSKYCQALLQIASNLNHSARIVAALGFAEAIHPLGRRIDRIMDPRIYRWAQLSFGTVVSIAILAALVLPGLRSERPTISTDTPLALEVPASSEPQVAAGLSEKTPTNTQNQTEELADSFPQQIEGVQPRNYLTVTAASKAAAFSANPKALKTMDSADSRNQGNGGDSHDSITDIAMPVATRQSDIANEQSSRPNNYSQFTPLLSSTFSEYSGSPDGGAGFGSVAVDTQAFDILAGRQAGEEPSINLTAAPLARNVSEQYSSSLTSSAEQWLSSELPSLALNNLIESSGIFGPLEPSLALSSFPDTMSISTALMGALDTGISSSSHNPLDDEVLLASATPVTSFGDNVESVESVEDEADVGMVLARALDIGDSRQLYYSASGTNVFDLSDSAEAIEALDVTDSVALAYADVPSSIDFTDSLILSGLKGNFITSSLSNPDGASVLAASSSSLAYSSGSSRFDTIPDAMVSYPAAAVPEPMAIWTLLVGSLLSLYRRQRARRTLPTKA